MPRVRRAEADAEIILFNTFSLPASPGNRIREPEQARAAPAEVHVPRLPRVG
jgi:hypothetical protein